MAASIALLAGCGGGGSTAPTATTTGTGSGTGTGTGTTTAAVSSLSLGTSAISIKTDNSTTATLTATPLDASNAAIADVTVTFATTSGVLSASTQKSGATGVASVTLSSGSIDSSNRTATVTVTAGGKTTSIPVLITGSTLTLTPSAGSVQVGAGTITLAAAAKDAAGTGKNGQTIRFTIAAASTGAATLSSATLTTGVTGSTSNVTLTPTSAGTVVVAAEWLDSSGAVSVSTTQSITVTAAAGIPFAISTPSTDSVNLDTAATQALAVSIPATINGKPVAAVRISSTAGTWTGLSPADGPKATIIQTPVNNAVAATFTAPGTSGVVQVQVDALDGVLPSSASLSNLTRRFVVSAPVPSATKLSLQSSVSVIAPSSGTNLTTATLTATVRDATNNSVGNAPVLFELLGTTGSGESVAPTVAWTDGNGKATATFTAGSSSSLGQVFVRARLADTTCSAPATAPTVGETNALCNAIPINVALQATSITVGVGTTAASVSNDTQYSMNGSVLVVDTNNSPVTNALVTLSVFPYLYTQGKIVVAPGGGCATSPSPLIYIANEDTNRNGILDPSPPEDSDGNGRITPPQAAVGAVASTVSTDAPGTVKTNSNGVATFTIIYPKNSAWLIKDEVTAKVTVSGTEQSAKTTFLLLMTDTDASLPGCPLAQPNPFF